MNNLFPRKLNKANEFLKAIVINYYHVLKLRTMKNPFLVLLFFTVSILFVSCEKDLVNDEVIVVLDDTTLEVKDWTENTHGNTANPNYNEVFEDNAIKRLDIVVSAAHWQNMLDDMTKTYGEFGGGGSAGLHATDENPVFVPAEVNLSRKQTTDITTVFKGHFKELEIIHNKKQAQHKDFKVQMDMLK